MLSHKAQDAQQVEEELQDIMHALAANGEQQGTQYVSVLQVSAAAKPTAVKDLWCLRSRLWNQWLQGLLNHTVPDEIEELEGMYKQAFDRIMNQVCAAVNRC